MATKPKGAGTLRSLLHFQRRSVVDDGFGNEVTGEYETVFTDAAELKPRMGSEPVIASRLQGVQPYTIRVRANTSTRSIDATGRAVDARTGGVFAIVSPFVDMDQRGAYLEGLATVGGQAST